MLFQDRNFIHYYKKSAISHLFISNMPLKQSVQGRIKRKIQTYRKKKKSHSFAIRLPCEKYKSSHP